MRLEIYQDARWVRTESFMGDTVRMGSHRLNELLLEGDGIARFHAVIQRGIDGDGFIIRDVSARIRLNGIPISMAKLRQGDRIEAGQYQIVVASEEALGDWDGTSSVTWGDPLFLLTKKKAL